MYGSSKRVIAIADSGVVCFRPPANFQPRALSTGPLSIDIGCAVLCKRQRRRFADTHIFAIEAPRNLGARFGSNAGFHSARSNIEALLVDESRIVQDGNPKRISLGEGGRYKAAVVNQGDEPKEVLYEKDHE